ncbi:PucR family transcriptional regulator [Actinomadura rugatobispora]|uniref:PucR family transcriptional regulator n=1 Tax=Actinomadura rugatobispora TaxID=1994 RepID=A0ABW1A566_9ACTN|nr:PucR family transcriptional regulator [Actinomadura rugatobispora]
MSLILRDVLRYEPFRRAGARVLAGEDGLDRAVRWVHISEMPDSARLFTGGELLLTQGMGISRDADAQRAWVRALARTGLAGVAIEVGVTFAAVPHALVEAADEAGLPLIALRTPAYFMDMTQAVHSVIVNAHYGMLQRAEGISRRFSRLAMEGAGLPQMIAELARAVDHPVVLSDEAHEVIAYAPDTPELRGWVDGWSAHARVGHPSPPDGSPVAAESAGLACAWVPIVARGELWGTIHMLARPRPIDDVDRLALDRAAAAIGLAFASVSDLERQRLDARSTFVHDLLGGRYEDVREMRLKASTFGADLSGPLLVLVMRPLATELPEEGRGDRLGRPLRAVTTVTGRVFGVQPRPLIGYDGGQLIAVLPAPGGEPRERTAEVVEQCAARHGVDLLVGLGDPVGMDGLPRAYGEACEAVRYGLRTGHGRGVLSPDDLGIDRLLMDLDQGPALARHVARELGRLLDHDATAGSPLLPTLAAYLEHGGRKAEVARALNIERRTLYYRLERLADLVNGPLDDTDTRLRLLVALRGRDFRRRTRGRMG